MDQSSPAAEDSTQPGGLLEFLGHSFRTDEEGFLTFASSVKLHENPIRIVNKYAADLTIGASETL
jgi:hypothetical protein